MRGDFAQKILSQTEQFGDAKNVNLNDPSGKIKFVGQELWNI